MWKALALGGVGLVLGACTVDLGFPLADRGEIERKPLEFTAPVNLPPDNYTGDLWVDNDGCIFLRSQNDDWVPQVNQRRIQMCDRAAMLAYLERVGRGEPGQSQQETISETALNVEQALATVSVENAGAAPATFAALPIDREPPEDGQIFVHISTVSAKDEFAQIVKKFESRDLTVYGTNQPEGALVLGPYQKGTDVQDALVTAWSFGFLNAFPFKN